jgi:hypothetical protein
MAFFSPIKLADTVKGYDTQPTNNMELYVFSSLQNSLICHSLLNKSNYFGILNMHILTIPFLKIYKNNQMCMKIFTIMSTAAIFIEEKEITTDINIGIVKYLANSNNGLFYNA